MSFKDQISAIEEKQEKGAAKTSKSGEKTEDKNSAKGKKDVAEENQPNEKAEKEKTDGVSDQEVKDEETTVPESETNDEETTPEVQPVANGPDEDKTSSPAAEEVETE